MALIEAGQYRARATNGVLGETKGGKEQVVVAFTLLDFPGQNMNWYGFFTEKTTEGTFRSLRTAGWKGSDLSDLSDLSKEDAPEVVVVVEHEADQQGAVRARIRWVNGTNGVGLKATLPPDKAKAFAARMKGKVVAFDRATGAPAQPAKTAPAKRPVKAVEVPQEVLDAQEGEHSTDDIPF